VESMKSELYYYDIYPKVFPVGRDVEITVKSLGAKFDFSGEYKIVVQRVAGGSTWQHSSADNHTDIFCTADESAEIHFTYTAALEGEYRVRIYQGDNLVVQLGVYAPDHDLATRYPLRGDLHIHTYRSDGGEAPAFVCANYRKKGYDFIVVTDHHRYYPSLEAIDAFSGLEIPLCILPGEEVHLPSNDVHIVNAGGLFSVNGLLKESINYADTNGDPEKRRFDKSVPLPDLITNEQYYQEIAEIEKSLGELPDGVDGKWYASSVWAFDKIREAGGLAIFAHPYWLVDMWHLQEPFTRYMMKNHPFDAFEVLGGENYYMQNGIQTALYYDEYREGRVHPIVGSTDSHGCTEHNINSAICSTIVFAEKNERETILQAIRDKYSIAVDTISAEYRLVGEYRLQKYACFLMENYFPIHDRQAALDGEMLIQYVGGNATKDEVEAVSARADKLLKKYILISD